MSTKANARQQQRSKTKRSWLRDILLDWDKTQLAVGLLILLLAGLSPLVVDSPYYMNIIILTVLYAYVGLTWNIVGGFAGMLLIGFITFFGVGAYTTMMLLHHFGLTPWLGIPAAAVTGALFGQFIAFLTLRYGLKEDYFALFTIAFMFMMGIIVSQIQAAGGAMGLWVTFRGESLLMMTFRDKAPYLYIALALLLFGLLVNYAIYRSKFGKYLLAIREDEAAAEALGVYAAHYKRIALTVSAAMAAIGGGFYVIYTTFVEPPLVFGLAFNVELLVAPIIGGKGTIIGPILGAILNKPVVEIVRGEFAAVRAGTNLVIYGALLMMFILFLPRGVAGLLYGPYNKLRARLLKNNE